MSLERCPFCREISTKLLETPVSGDKRQYDCPRCGTYQLTGTAEAVAISYLGPHRKEWHKAAASHAVRKAQQSGPFIIDSDAFHRLMELDEPPTPLEQADYFVSWLGSRHLTGKDIELRYYEIMGFIGVSDFRGVEYIAKAISDLGLATIRIRNDPRHHDTAQLTLKGWQRYEALKRSRPDSRTAFMAQQFGDTELDFLVNNHFRTAVAETGFTLRRVDDVPRAGLIDDQLRVDIRNARFLICDLSHGNRGAYWEAGYAEGLGKPVIYTCKKQAFDANDTRPHFDTNHHLTVIWSEDDPADAVRRLKATIRATILDAIQEDAPCLT